MVALAWVVVLIIPRMHSVRTRHLHHLFACPELEEARHIVQCLVNLLPGYLLKGVCGEYVQLVHRLLSQDVMRPETNTAARGGCQFLLSHKYCNGIQ